jgi:hypothetical protein
MSILKKPDGIHWRDFEHLCLILFEHEFQALDANFYGTHGVGQHGIDIRMSTQKRGIQALVVVQCKATQSLTWTDFAEDFKRALKKFARETLDAGRHFRFIVATTAEKVNNTKFDDPKKKLLHELGLDGDGDATRIDLQAYSWPRLEAIVEKDVPLQKLFIHQERDADKSSTQTLRQLGPRIATLTEDRRLDSAFAELSAYLRLEKPDAADKFGWVPSAMFEQLTNMFLAAGDFHNANPLLEVALGTNPLNAGYLLGYLRAQRVLHATPLRHPVGLTMMDATPAPRSMAIQVVEMAEQLLRSWGTTDAQLTLALWVVSYAPTQALADRGLRRGLGLATQAWPEDVNRLDHGAWYSLTAEGYLIKQPDALAFRPPASEDHLRACALACAYLYIRAIYTARFGSDPLRQIEHEHGGWPQDIEELSGYAPFRFFAEMAPVCTTATQTHLPLFYAEGSERESHWQPDSYPRFARSPYLHDRTYVATPEFLLRDCVNGLVNRRVKEFGGAGWTADGATIMISHLGIERLVRAQLGKALEYETQGEYGRAAGPVADNIGVVLARLVRHESTPNHLLANFRPPFGAHPCYANFAPERHGDSLDASLALSRRLGLSFLVASAAECELAAKMLPKRIECLSYWTPPYTY